MDKQLAEERERKWILKLPNLTEDMHEQKNKPRVEELLTMQLKETPQKKS